jgi:hypothetical protein
MKKTLVLFALALPLFAFAGDEYDPKVAARLNKDIATIQKRLAAAESRHDDKAIAQQAYQLAATYAKASNKGYKCDTEAYTMNTLEALAKATTRSAYIRNAARTNKDLVKAIGTSLTYRQLTSDFSAEKFAKNLEGTVFENTACGAICPLETLTFKAGGKVVRGTRNWDDLRMKNATGTYELIPTAKGYQIVVRIGGDVQTLNLSVDKGVLTTYGLDGADAGEDSARYTNIPSECEA